MSVVRGRAARNVLRARLYGEPAPDGVVHRAYDPDRNDRTPRGFLADAGSVETTNWLWAEPAAADGDPPAGDSRHVPALTDPAAYRLQANVPLARGLTSAEIHATPAAGAASARSDDYYRLSADVVMRGGIASGVVYPGALCEIARRFRLRSLGGSSAGAIAAAAGAAAELGRMRLDLTAEVAGTPDSDPAPTTGPARPPDSSDPDAGGHAPRFGQGFVGLAELTAWVAESDRADSGESRTPPASAGDGPPQFRVAGLFQPASATRPLFRFVLTVLERRYRTAAVLLPFAAGPVFGALAGVGIVLVLLALAGAGPTMPRDPSALAVAALLLGAPTLLTAGAVVVTAPEHYLPGGLLLGAGAVAAGNVTVVLADTRSTSTVVWVWIAALGAWVVAAVMTLTLIMIPVVRTLLAYERHRYGLLGGADPAPAGRLSRALDAVAGLPAGRPVTLWLEQVLDDLAGQPDGESLRFGHLWLGDEYRPPGDRPEGLEIRLCRAAGDSGLRRVNLELIASELTEGLAYRIPADTARSAPDITRDCLVDPHELCDERRGRLFSARVIAALADRADHPAHEGCPYETPAAPADEQKSPLPHIWDLPVVFAVRCSMALPGVFQAIPLHTRQAPDDLADEFGRTLDPPERSTPSPTRPMWFSDGGLTSNFPVHLFDSPLPRWPTLGINLGKQPPREPARAGSATDRPDKAKGAEKADGAAPAAAGPPRPPDVTMPLDGHGVRRGRSIGQGVHHLIGAMFSTSRNWRDNELSLSPPFAGRIAEVRLASGEGDMNIRMTAEDVAALTLRGIVAGARLRRRWEHDQIWHRHQWLRMSDSSPSGRQLLDQAREADALQLYAQYLARRTEAVEEMYSRLVVGDPFATVDPLEPRWAEEVAQVWAELAGRRGTAPRSAAPAYLPKLTSRTPG